MMADCSKPLVRRILTDVPGQITRETRTQCDKLQGLYEDPAIVTRDAETDRVIEIQRRNLGMLEGCDDQPAIVKYDRETGQVLEEAFYHMDQRSRACEHWAGEEKPSRIFYARTTGDVIGEEWYFCDVQSRSFELPSTWMMDEKTGVITREEYWYKGGRHRLDGPALIVRDRANGEIVESEWHIDGVRIAEQDDEIFEPHIPEFR